MARLMEYGTIVYIAIAMWLINIYSCTSCKWTRHALAS